MKLKILFSTVTLAAVVAAACAPHIAESMVPNIQITKAEVKDYNRQISCSGTIENAGVSEVSLPYPIVAQKIHCNIGDQVKQGDVLITVDQQSTKSALWDLLQSKGVSLDGLSLQNTQEFLKSLPAELLSQIPFNISEVLNSLPKNYENMQLTDVFDNIAVQEQITAPGDGIVTGINASYSSLSNTAQPIITISKGYEYVAKVKVSESNISLVQQGMDAKITGVALDGKEYQAKVVSIDKQAQKNYASVSQDTVVEVGLQILEPDNVIKSGYNIKADIAVEPTRKVLSVPYEAIGQDETNKEFVYVYNGGSVKKQEIVTGVEFENGVEVMQGIAENDYVIVNPKENQTDYPIACIESYQGLPQEQR